MSPHAQHYVEYLDATYTFISIMSLIEALYMDEPHVDFYQWLTVKKHERQVFPIADPEALRVLYQEYKSTSGHRQVVRFFTELDESAQKYRATRLGIDSFHEPAEVLARKLYIIRSEFVHQARPVLEFNHGSMFSKRAGTVLYSLLCLTDLQLLFEHGLLLQFHITPDIRRV